jgi:hypothetical protein
MTSQIVQEALSHPMVEAGKVPKTSNAKAGEGKVAQYAERISAKWYRTTATIFEVSTDCFAAREELSVLERHALIERLPFGASMFSKLASIGGDDRLKKNQKLLPPSISTIDLFRKLSDEQFENAKTEKMLRPDATRDQVEEWKRSKTKKTVRRQVTAPELPSALYCVYPEQLLDAEQHAKLWSAVVEMAESQGLKAATFTGENLIGQIKTFFVKKVGKT